MDKQTMRCLLFLKEEMFHVKKYGPAGSQDQSQLRQGLAELLKEKSLKEITVKELVEKVDINRSTSICTMRTSMT